MRLHRITAPILQAEIDAVLRAEGSLETFGAAIDTHLPDLAADDRQAVKAHFLSLLIGLHPGNSQTFGLSAETAGRIEALFHSASDNGEQSDVQANVTEGRKKD